jgi:hypothetical protein
MVEVPCGRFLTKYGKTMESFIPLMSYPQFLGVGTVLGNLISNE